MFFLKNCYHALAILITFLQQFPVIDHFGDIFRCDQHRYIVNIRSNIDCFKIIVFWKIKFLKNPQTGLHQASPASKGGRELSPPVTNWQHKRDTLYQSVPFIWRRERDLNPRSGLTDTRFPVVRLRPAQPSLHKYSIVKCAQLHFTYLISAL